MKNQLYRKAKSKAYYYILTTNKILFSIISDNC